MTNIMAEWFSVIGIDMVPPQTFSELIPYLLTVAVGVGLVLYILKMFKALVKFVLRPTSFM